MRDSFTVSEEWKDGCRDAFFGLPSSPSKSDRKAAGRYMRGYKAGKQRRLDRIAMLRRSILRLENSTEHSTLEKEHLLPGYYRELEKLLKPS